MWLSESVKMTEMFGDQLDVAVYLCCSEIIGTAFKSVISNSNAAQTKNQNKYCHIADGQTLLLFKNVADDAPRLGDIAQLVQYD